MILLQPVTLTMPAANLESPCAFFGSGSASLAFCPHLSLVLASFGKFSPQGPSLHFRRAPLSLLLLFCLQCSFYLCVNMRLSRVPQLHPHLVDKLFLTDCARKILRHLSRPWSLDLTTQLSSGTKTGAFINSEDLHRWLKFYLILMS